MHKLEWQKPLWDIFSYILQIISILHEFYQVIATLGAKCVLARTKYTEEA